MKPLSNRSYAAVALVACAGLWLSASRGGAPAVGELPEAVKQAVAKILPGGQINEMELERRTVQLYEVSVATGGRQHEITITADGTVLEMEEKIESGKTPEAVMKKLRDLAGDAKLKEIERIEVRDELKVVPLGTPRVEYEAEYGVKGKERHIRLSEDGKQVGGESEDDDDDDDKEDDK